jgi:hypothetical protein
LDDLQPDRCPVDVLAQGVGLRDADRRDAGAAAAPGEREDGDNGGEMPIPTPIGVGPRYHPPALHARCETAVAANRVHLELFANRRVVLIPPRIGCWTTDPTGVVHYARGATLGGFFRAWRQRLTRTRLLSFRGRVQAWRNGRAVAGDPRAIRLRDGDELVLEIGGYVPPHRTYLFPPH